MGKQDTKYSEKERVLTGKILNRYGLNPFAADIIVKSYKEKLAPQPVSFDYEMHVRPNIASKEEQAFTAEVYLYTPGFLGKKKEVDVLELDKLALKMFVRSYLDHVRPQPISFVLDGVEVHIRTKGVSNEKNIARAIFNENT